MNSYIPYSWNNKLKLTLEVLSIILTANPVCRFCSLCPHGMVASDPRGRGDLQWIIVILILQFTIVIVQCSLVMVPNTAVMTQYCDVTTSQKSLFLDCAFQVPVYKEDTYGCFQAADSNLVGLGWIPVFCFQIVPGDTQLLITLNSRAQYNGAQ